MTMMMMMMMTACYPVRFENMNSDAGTGVGQMPEHACWQYCMARYPSCLAVDYRRSDGACYTHGVYTGTQYNGCCVRYHIHC